MNFHEKKGNSWYTIRTITGLTFYPSIFHLSVTVIFCLKTNNMHYKQIYSGILYSLVF